MGEKNLGEVKGNDKINMIGGDRSSDGSLSLSPKAGS